MFYNRHLILICIVNYYVYGRFLALNISVVFLDVFLISHYSGRGFVAFSVYN